ncbi:hypothetical protein MOB49_11590 [Bacillus haynesii]|uniref:hypothetical protein n=1 Tax=Bacillus haynesii TaxID=1925021 RepID=UPI00227E9DAB|nr:hypothetical protein [Bacillus haynesii]MCY7967735.1 hypothetical protein [Bacillus haynesii]
MDKALLHEMITELQQRTKAGELDRIERIEEITALADAYYDSVGEHPDSTALERMANLVIYEELSDSHPDKMTREEYPIMSETQLSRRKEGKHRKKEANYRIEVPFKLAENVGVDGKNYALPVRRERSLRENMAVDEQAKSRNKELRKRYNDFINGRTPGQFTVNIATGEKIIH